MSTFTQTNTVPLDAPPRGFFSGRLSTIHVLTSSLRSITNIYALRMVPESLFEQRITRVPPSRATPSTDNIHLPGLHQPYTVATSQCVRLLNVLLRFAGYSQFAATLQNPLISLSSSYLESSSSLRVTASSPILYTSANTSRAGCPPIRISAESMSLPNSHSQLSAAITSSSALLIRQQVYPHVHLSHFDPHNFTSVLFSSKYLYLLLM